jgi:hypothetical protein
MFRVLHVCEVVISENGGRTMDSLDALLGCPMLLFHKEIVKNISDLTVEQRIAVCWCLFHAVNW